MRKSEIKEYLSENKIKKKIKKTKDVWQLKRWQVIYFRMVEKDWDAQKIADVLSIKKNTVFQWVWKYNKYGPQEYERKARGGRRNAHMSLEEEKEILESIRKKAEKGKVITAQIVTMEAEKYLKRILSKDYAYDLLHRHKWSKIKPRPYHPKRNIAKQESFKKTLKLSWEPPKQNFL